MFLTEKLLFIHIPKNAGSSMVYLLEKNFSGRKDFDIDTHSTFDLFKKKYLDLCKNKTSFCLIRNPFCRFVSIYRFFNREIKLRKWFGKDFLKVMEKIDSFEKFIENFEFPKKAWGENNLYTNQNVWANNTDYVFKIEEQHNLKDFFRKNNILGELPLINNRSVPSWRNKMYRDYYNSNTKKIIQKKFRVVLEIYKYNF